MLIALAYAKKLAGVSIKITIKRLLNNGPNYVEEKSAFGISDYTSDYHLHQAWVGKENDSKVRRIGRRFTILSVAAAMSSRSFFIFFILTKFSRNAMTCNRAQFPHSGACRRLTFDQ